jgi:peptide-methionine (S)-S-oxide reductase
MNIHLQHNHNNYNISGIETATFGAGCFWCIEAIFQQIKGVVKVVPGYAGGSACNPTYSIVSSGESGHAEVCLIDFDTNIVSFDELLEIFWIIHDPTSLNCQGIDVGLQFRSLILYHNQKQKCSADEYKQMLNESGFYPKPIVTDIIKFTIFYKAEDYHHDYFHKNNHQPYCMYVIQPKLDKFRLVFKDKLKSLKSIN